jgi:hypothetical protein
MILCKCGHENKTLLNPRFWKDLGQYIGECNSCRTSIHFVYKGSEIERATLSKEALEKLRKKIRNANRIVA